MDAIERELLKILSIDEDVFKSRLTKVQWIDEILCVDEGSEKRKSGIKKFFDDTSLEKLDEIEQLMMSDPGSGCSEDGGDQMFSLPSNILDPERSLMEKEIQWAKDWFYHELSEEAKQVMGLIENPGDLKDVIGTKNTISIHKLKDYLRKQWEERKIVKDVLQEIAEYTVKVESYQ